VRYKRPKEESQPSEYACQKFLSHNVSLLRTFIFRAPFIRAPCCYGAGG
jgi:hypothetical protein